MMAETINPYLQPQLELLAFFVEQVMPLKNWGFKLSRKFCAQYRPGPLSLQSGKGGIIPTVIYDSEKCRVMFQYEPAGYAYHYGTFIYYGRLHANDDMPIMEWKKEDCHCWHSIEMYTMAFLQGVSATEYVKNGRLSLRKLENSPKSIHLDETHIRESIEKLGFKNINTEYILSPLNLHTAIWDEYGDSLFNLFDLENNETWSNYSQFLKEIYDIKGRDTFYPPEFDKVC